MRNIVASNLKSRERVVLALSSLGVTDTEIAEACRDNPNNVKQIRRNILKKLSGAESIEADGLNSPSN